MKLREVNTTGKRGVWKVQWKNQMEKPTNDVLVKKTSGYYRMLDEIGLMHPLRYQFRSSLKTLTAIYPEADRG